MITSMVIEGKISRTYDAVTSTAILKSTLSAPLYKIGPGCTVKIRSLVLTEDYPRPQQKRYLILDRNLKLVQISVQGKHL